MTDRNVQFPQRYQLKKVEGTEDIYDLIPAPGEISAEGTLINKATLWKDATAALFGLGVDSVPDDGFAFLGKYNQHWWRRTPMIIEESEEKQRSIANTAYTGSTYAVGIKYSDKVQVSGNGEISLVDPIETYIGYSVVFDENILNGKYFTPFENRGTSTTSDLTVDVIYKGNSDIIKQYVDSQGYKCFITCAVTSVKRGEIEYVQSSDRSSYPDSGEQDGYEYEYLGIPFENAVGAPKIVTGSYIGNGKFGKSNPNIITLAHRPKALIIHGVKEDSSSTSTPSYALTSTFLILSEKSAGTYDEGYAWIELPSTRRTITSFSFDDNSISWYSTSNSNAQANGARKTYYYIAIC